MFFWCWIERSYSSFYKVHAERKSCELETTFVLVWDFGKVFVWVKSTLELSLGDYHTSSADVNEKICVEV
jgi:hypothetical protein